MSEALDTLVAAEAEVRHLFLIEADPDLETLSRVLGPFVVAGAAPSQLSFRTEGTSAEIRIETSGLDPARAQLILRRLEAMACVRRVGRGWR